MQARLETRQFPAAAVAIVFAIAAVFALSAGSGYMLRPVTAPSAHQAVPVRVQSVDWGSSSDLTRVLPHEQAQGGPMSDLTRVLPRDQAQGGPMSDLTRVLPTEEISNDCGNRLAHYAIRVRTVC